MENLCIGLPGKRDTEQEEYVFTCFPRLKERIKQSGNTLSGGEQQMLAIARCLMMRPKLIILDEPTEGIMPLLVSQILREIHRINQSGVSILLVEQNVETALKLCPRVFLMEKGTVVYSGTSHELKSQTAIVHRYLGLSR
jgi:branched-chain amino acid transport system ATP-binding protein